MKRKLPQKAKRFKVVDGAEVQHLLGKVLPAGKPEEMGMNDYFKSVLHIVDKKTNMTFADSIIQKQCELAAMGSSKAAEFIFDRAFGKPTQTIVQQSQPVVSISHRVINIDEAKQE